MSETTRLVRSSKCPLHPSPQAPAGVPALGEGPWSVEGCCDVCGCATPRTRCVTCVDCGSKVHTACLGLGKHALPAGLFQCAQCTLFAARVELLPVSAGAVEAAHRLVWLRAKRVQDTSQTAYASGLHKYAKFITEVLNLPLDKGLPHGVHEGPHAEQVEMFIAWAASKYKISTIRLSIAALSDWCSSKGASKEAIKNPRVAQLLKTVAAEQGPEGLPVGKEGMTMSQLGLVMAYISECMTTQPLFMSLFLRDMAWLVLGFFGFLRRSELISLQMQDVTFGSMSHLGYIKVRIRKSKTDRAGKGDDVVISARTAGGWDLQSKVRAYHAFRTKSGAKEEDPFLVGWDLDNLRLGASGLKSGEALSMRLRKYLVELKQRYPKLKINPMCYAMHSLRRGGVLAACKAGVDLERIKCHGRWRSNAVKAYLTAGLDIKMGVTAVM